MMKKIKYFVPHLVAILTFTLGLSLSFATGAYFGYANRPEVATITALANKEIDQSDQVDFSAFWKTWNLLNEKYVSDQDQSTTSQKITDQEKVWGAIAGLVASLGDPYTVFLPPEKKKVFEADISGNFEGVGMEIGIKDNSLTVVAPLADSPAKRAGIQAGDKILLIDGLGTQNLSTDEAVSKIRGPKGTKVKLNIFRQGISEPFDITITRDVIVMPIIDSRTLGNGIYLIQLHSFTENSPKLFKEHLDKFIRSGNQRLILDLRGNPGGYMEAAIDMASWFLPKGQLIVRESRGVGQDKNYLSRGYDIFNQNLKLAILIDQGSASASEILAGALAEQGRAKLIGEKTFGKGSVQELVPVTKDTSLKVTVAKWYTPKGKSLSQHGLEPDIKVEQASTTPSQTAQPAEDLQLAAAIKYLIGQ